MSKTRILHTAWVRNIENVRMNRVRKMINIEFGNEIKKDVFRHVISIIRAPAFIIAGEGRRGRIFGEGGSHGFLGERRRSVVANRE